MTLKELLYTIDGDTEVGIWDIRRTGTKHPKKYEKQPTRQTYSKVKNLRYGDIKDLLDLDILGVHICKDGLLIRIYDKEKVDRKLNHYDLANEIKKQVYGKEEINERM